ncbi:MAG TPA: hypothetical protein VGC96_04440 [Candidatus Elarobacter sp.]
MLAYVALGAFVLALASPTPAPKGTPPAKNVFTARTPAPAPKPEASNPFNLNPIPLPSASLPVIGTTRAKPVCTAIRRAVAPAITAAMKVDQSYEGLRKRVFDYVVKDSEAAKDLHLKQMDTEVDVMLKNVNAIEDALKSPSLDITATTKPEDAKTLRDIKRTLAGVLAGQKTELNAMSGFVETERMRRFGELSEGEKNMQRAIMPTQGGYQTPFPVSGFLRDTNTTLDPTRRSTVNGLADAHLLDRDLGDIAKFTANQEDQASKVIVSAANTCK